MSIYNAMYKLIKATREKEMLPVIVPTENSELLSGKVAFIAGGSGGIGMAIAEQLLRCGCKVILGGTNTDKLDRCRIDLMNKNDDYSVESHLFRNDNVSELKEAFESIAKVYGKMDIFINAAGVHTENLDFWNLDPEEYDRIMNINLKGPYFSCLAAAKYMISNKIEGQMLLISSSRGSEPTWSPYGISKNCIDSMVHGLAKQFVSYGITITGLAPGPTATSLIGVNKGDSIYSEETQLKRLAMPEEIASYAALLVSPAGKIATGEVLHVSGGRGLFDIR